MTLTRSLLCRHSGLPRHASLGGPLCPCRVQLQQHRIIIPTLPQPSSGSTSRGGRLGRDGTENEEYEASKRLSPGLGSFLDQPGAESLRRQQQLDQFREATDATVTKLWRDSKPHLRHQEQLIKELGVEGAVRETLSPSSTSFHAELRQRPLDRAILEEIYHGLHGRRIERRLKRGVSWEHWITKGDGTAPVYNTSRKAQQTFAFGGHIRQVRLATHPQQFPVLTIPGRPPQHEGRGSGGAPHPSPRRGRKGLSASPTLSQIDRELLLPEVAFIGRTSSGKSSLMNAIVNATVAPYGHLQGTTSSVRFYSVADRIMLVDCPGYGYYNPTQTPPLDAENAVKAMRAYLRTGARRLPLRESSNHDKSSGAASTSSSGHPHTDAGDVYGMKADAEGEDDGIDGPSAGPSSSSSHTAKPAYQPRNVKRVFLCVPSRGMQHSDLAYCELLERLGIPFSVVLTKTDAAPVRFLARLTDYTRSQLVRYSCCKELMLTSALRLAGIDKMQNVIGSVALDEDQLHGASMDFSSIV